MLAAVILAWIPEARAQDGDLRGVMDDSRDGTTYLDSGKKAPRHFNEAPVSRQLLTGYGDGGSVTLREPEVSFPNRRCNQ